MRQLLVGSIAAVTLIAIGGAAYAWQASNYRNIPGPITGSYAAGIKGSFNILQVGPTEGIPSPPIGGACIVFPAKDLGFTQMQHKNCKKDGDCETSEGSGYCHLPTGKCWARPVTDGAHPDPDPYLCRRGHSIPGQDIPISTTPALISDPAWHISPHTKARVIALLRCDPSNDACGPDGQGYVLEWGTPKQL